MSPYLAEDEYQALRAERDRGLDLAKALCGSRDIDEAFAVVEAWVQEADRYRAALEKLAQPVDPDEDLWPVVEARRKIALATLDPTEAPHG